MSGQQYDISEEELRQIQDIQQEMIGEVARICREGGWDAIRFGEIGGARNSGNDIE